MFLGADVQVLELKVAGVARTVTVLGGSELLVDSLRVALRGWAQFSASQPLAADVTVRFWSSRNPVQEPVRGRALLWSRQVTPSHLAAARRCGYLGVLEEGVGAKHLIQVLQRVSEGKEYGLIRDFSKVGQVIRPQLPSSSHQLSEQEKRILIAYSLTYRHHSRAEVAQMLGISENSVKTYLTRIRGKLPAGAAPTREALYDAAVYHGLILGGQGDWCHE